MRLTSRSELVQRNVAADPAFGEALLREGIDTTLTGDVETGKAILRDYIKATVGFEKLGEATGTQPKSLIRMFGPRGNPQARNLFSVIGYLQKRAGVELHVTTDVRDCHLTHRRPCIKNHVVIFIDKASCRQYICPHGDRTHPQNHQTYAGAD